MRDLHTRLGNSTLESRPSMLHLDVFPKQLDPMECQHRSCLRQVAAEPREYWGTATEYLVSNSEAKVILVFVKTARLAYLGT